MKHQSNTPPNFKFIGLLLLSFAIVFNAIFLWPEVSISTYSINDGVLHLSATQAASNTLAQGQNPTDFWFPNIGLGFPIFHYYQHLPHLVLAAINQLTSRFLPLPRLFDISQYLLLVLFPLSIFIAIRRFDFDYLSAGFAALISSLLSTDGLYGLDFNSYLWRGPGLYTQLWAMFLLPLALAEVYRILKNNGSWFWSVFLSTAVILSHLIYGYILVLSAIVFLFLNPKKAEIISRFKRFIINFGLTAIVTAYFFIPFIVDQNYYNRSIWEAQFKYDSLGAPAILKYLFTGNLLDFGRLPILTNLTFWSILFVTKQRQKENHRLLLLLTAFWLLLYFGRPTWGVLLNLIPFSHDLHLHRFIGGFHLFAIMLIGAGLSLLCQRLRLIGYFSKFPKSILAILALILLFLPILSERVKYYQQNRQWKLDSQNVILAKSSQIADIQKTLASLPPGRVYAGMVPDFGKYPYYKIGAVSLFSLLPQLGIDSFGHAFYALPLTNDTRIVFDNTKVEQYNLFNIRYVLLHKTWTAPDYYSKIKEFDDYLLYQIPTTGYFDLVDTPAVFYGSKNDFYSPNSKWLFSSLPRQKQYPILQITNLPLASNLPAFNFSQVDEKILSSLSNPQPSSGQILSEKIDINKYSAQFTANRNCFLILKTNFHPGWHVTLDSVDTTPVMLSPGYIGIYVTSGTHQATFQYQPSPLRNYLMILSLFTLSLVLLIHKKRYPT